MSADEAAEPEGPAGGSGMQDRLAGVKDVPYARARWLYMAVFTAMCYGAAGVCFFFAFTEDSPQLIGLAVLPTVGALLFTWVAYATRSALRGSK